MRNSFSTGGMPAGNPIANALVVVAGSLAIVASLILGFFAFVVVGSLVAILASVIGIRVWWLRRKFKSTLTGNAAAQKPEAGVIEGEYQVVADDDEGA